MDFMVHEFKNGGSYIRFICSICLHKSHVQITICVNHRSLFINSNAYADNTNAFKHMREHKDG